MTGKEPTRVVFSLLQNDKSDLRTLTCGRASATVSSSFRIPSAVFRSLSTIVKYKKKCYQNFPCNKKQAVSSFTTKRKLKLLSRRAIKLTVCRLFNFFFNFRVRALTNWRHFTDDYIVTSSIWFFLRLESHERGGGDGESVFHSLFSFHFFV